MFLDIEGGLLFVHNPKAAGISIRIALGTLRGDGRPQSRIFKIKNDHENKVSSHGLRTMPNV